MKIIFGNLNWLFLLLILGTLAISFFYLPLFWLIFNTGILISMGLLVFYHSVTAAKANSAQKTEEHRLNTIINNLHDGVIAYDENFKILVFNPAAEQIFNLRAGEVIGQSFTLKVRQDSSLRLKTLLTILFPALASMIVRRTELGVYPQVVDISFDEPSLELRVSTSRILDSEGKVLGFVKLVHDRTRELTLLRSKSEFITIASHQLRTPLTAANWAVEGLTKEPLTTNQKDLLANITGAVNRLMKIVDDLLDVARIEEGRFGYTFQEIDLISFLEDALAQAKDVAAQYRVKLYFDKPRQETVKAIFDPQKLAMVVSNLLDNAVKYNIPNGEVILKVEKVPENPYVRVSVKDTGIGIPSEGMNKVFTKFFRAENAAKIAVEGTGLGLYIGRNIIRRHGGQIWVESTLNRGSVFYFTLPTNPTLVPAKEIVYEEEI